MEDANNLNRACDQMTKVMIVLSTITNIIYLLLFVFQAKQSIPVMSSDNYHSVVSEQTVVRHQQAVNVVWSDAQLLAKEWSDLVVRYKEMRNNMRMRLNMRMRMRNGY